MTDLRHLESAARRKLGASQEWLGYRYESFTGGYLVVGAIPVGFVSRGPRKGKPKWKGEGDKVVLSNVEVQVEEEHYVRTTGNCPECFGTKEQFASWSVKEGLKTSPCQACGATGRRGSGAGG